MATRRAEGRKWQSLIDPTNAVRGEFVNGACTICVDVINAVSHRANRLF